MKVAVHRKWIFVGGAMIAIVAGSVASLSAATKGPYGCGTCSLDMPIPDDKTVDVIRANAPDWPFTYFESGNVYIVCNASACAEYVITDSGGIWGQNKQERTDAPGGGGGGGGSEGGSSGAGGGGGCVGSCGQGPGGTGSGTVTIGDDEPLPPKQEK